MRYSKWLAFFSAGLLFAACFLPWITIESKDITITGFDTTGTRWSPPGNLHTMFTAFYLVFTMIPRIWAKRLNVFIAAINMAWAIGNFIRMALCDGGECPVRQPGMYLALLATILMLVASFFPQVKMNEVNNTNP